MKRKEADVKPEELAGLSLNIGKKRMEALNEMARAKGYSKAAIVRNALYAALDKWQQERGV